MTDAENEEGLQHIVDNILNWGWKMNGLKHIRSSVEFIDSIGMYDELKKRFKERGYLDGDEKGPVFTLLTIIEERLGIK